MTGKLAKLSFHKSQIMQPSKDEENGKQRAGQLQSMLSTRSILNATMKNQKLIHSQAIGEKKEKEE